MTSAFFRLYLKCGNLKQAIQEDDGQDLVEYAAVIVLVVLALTGGMQTLANGINNAMTTVSTSINSILG
jgi:Flp pilus assembly pilin Flp